MDVNVRVTVDLGEKTVALLSGSMVVNSPVAKSVNFEEGKAKEIEAAKVDTVKTEIEKPARTRRTKEQIAEDEAQTANGWDDMDDDAKLEAIKTEVTKHTKKGKSADIKFLLANFDAGRASELATEDYDAFFDAITRYGKGENVDKIFPSNLD